MEKPWCICSASCVWAGASWGPRLASNLESEVWPKWLLGSVHCVKCDTRTSLLTSTGSSESNVSTACLSNRRRHLIFSSPSLRPKFPSLVLVENLTSFNGQNGDGDSHGWNFQERNMYVWGTFWDQSQPPGSGGYPQSGCIFILMILQGKMVKTDHVEGGPRGPSWCSEADSSLR